MKENNGYFRKYDTCVVFIKSFEIDVYHVVCFVAFVYVGVLWIKIRECITVKLIVCKRFLKQNILKFYGKIIVIIFNN